MPNAVLYDIKGSQIGEYELPEAVFGAEVNKSVLHDSVVNYLANQRQGTQSTKTRSEVKGGGKKPFRQKDTGRARQGSTRAPQWTNGGVALGPKPRDYSYNLNKKVKRLAMVSALSAKAEENEVAVVDNLSLDEIKTKAMAQLIDAVGEKNENVYLSTRNIKGAKASFVGMLNVYDILNSDILIAGKDAVDKLGEVYR